MDAPEPELRSLALRAYCVPPKPKDDDRNQDREDDHETGGAPWGPSRYRVIFDSETSIGPEQRLRVGGFQVRRDAVLLREGFYYDPEALTSRERRRLRDYVQRHGLSLLTDREFVEQVFYQLVYLRNALLVGFNIPFDAARLALGHQAARGRKMGGGFSFTLSDHWPHLRIKHLSRTAALTDFAAPGGRKKPRVRRGFFCDVHSLAAALTGSSHKLETLARLLDTPHQKMEAEHGRELDSRYLRYLANDVQVTWECFAVLAAEYAAFDLSQTPVSAILTEASIGKACLREMGVRPWTAVQPERT